MPPEVPPPPGLLCHMVFTDGHFHNMQFPVRDKTFSTHIVVEMNSTCVKNVLVLTQARELHSKNPDGDGG